MTKIDYWPKTKTETKMLTETKSPAIARKSRPYRLCLKPSIRLLVIERKRFVRSDTVSCTLC